MRADRIGRKPVVVLANFIMGLATLGLGLAPTYWLAVAARALGGAANGSGVAIKTMLAEACDAQSQARGMVSAPPVHIAGSMWSAFATVSKPLQAGRALRWHMLNSAGTV